MMMRLKSQKIYRNICCPHWRIVSESVIPLKSYCDKNQLFLIEDAAQAHGSSLKGIKAGNFGTAAAFSFFSTKVMTTGEGNSNNEFISTGEKMKSMKNLRKVKTGIYTNYHKYFGYNWRLQEVSALMGIRQLKSLDNFIKKTEIAKIYDLELLGLELSSWLPQEKSNHNYFKYIIIIEKFDRKNMHKF